jgi:uncharacterized membrane protein YdjX (TVP38/TMEM64 family)
MFCGVAPNDDNRLSMTTRASAAEQDDMAQPPSRDPTSRALDGTDSPPMADSAAPLVAGNARGRWSAVLTLAVVVVSAIAVFACIQIIGPDRLQEGVQAAGPLAPLAFVLLKASTVVVTPISGTPLRFAAGALFGFWQGVALSVCASALGGSINFWIARRFGRRIVVRLLGAGALARVEPLLGRLGNWRALVLARLVLAPFWDILCYGVGLTRLRYRTFLVVAVIGEVLPTMLMVGVGSSIMELGLRGTVAAGAADAETMLPLVGVLVVALLGVGLLIGVAALLRPRVLRLLARQAPAPESVNSPRRQPFDA